jgi:hypothetical protein
VGLDLALRYIPIVGPVLAFFFLCWVDASVRSLNLLSLMAHFVHSYYFFESAGLARICAATLTGFALDSCGQRAACR